MFPAISNLDISWPDPSVGGLDQTQKYLQASNQYIYPLATTNDSASVASFTNTNFGYIDVVISKDGMIAIAPYFAANFVYYDTLTGGSTNSLAGGRRYVSSTYSEYDNRFYYSAEGGGLYSQNAASTGSAISSVITGTTNRTRIGASGDKIWLNNSAGGKVAYLDLRNNNVVEVGTTVATVLDAPRVAPNGLVVYGSAGSTIYYYDPTTDSIGTFTGTVANDSSYNWILARDGFMYSVPRFTNTSVYRLNQYNRTISTVFTGSPYVANYKRGMWMAIDGTIVTVQNSNQMIAYNPVTNTATTLPFNFVYSSNQLHQGVTASNGAMFFLNSTNQLVRVNNINTRNLFNELYQGNPNRAGGQN